MVSLTVVAAWWRGLAIVAVVGRGLAAVAGNRCVLFFPKIFTECPI
jgi:hypothetical protein